MSPYNTLHGKVSPIGQVRSSPGSGLYMGESHIDSMLHWLD